MRKLKLREVKCDLPQILLNSSWTYFKNACINEILLNNNKEWNTAIYDNLDGTRGYYPKWNKSDREWQILYDFTYMCNIKNTKQMNKQNNKQMNKQNKLWANS